MQNIIIINIWGLKSINRLLGYIGLSFVNCTYFFEISPTPGQLLYLVDYTWLNFILALCLFTFIHISTIFQLRSFSSCELFSFEFGFIVSSILISVTYLFLSPLPYSFFIFQQVNLVENFLGEIKFGMRLMRYIYYKVAGRFIPDVLDWFQFFSLFSKK